ncbi:HCaRG protein (macronuclear) [Tetrahymena thermophila SB210]|uniref:HCaRG protein n=1 Tax=Tetrahymena thermophila (strain SB210) TaxID=312017 RepID=I7LT58_TETTS|nr:HCaRG protein [Tetrahymena thermophila SB210]EAR84444.1 HCaRG protein [Tetrahymena thermophila SB210]|eukprot:XP_001032107.1 HCaRG protein [Tetrahymena thermophila SB210]
MSASAQIQEFICDKKIADLEWRFAIATSNSSVKQYGDCFLQLKLITVDKDQKYETLQMDLDLQQFNELYNEISKIRSLVDFIK